MRSRRVPPEVPRTSSASMCSGGITDPLASKPTAYAPCSAHTAASSRESRARRRRTCRSDDHSGGAIAAAPSPQLHSAVPCLSALPVAPAASRSGWAGAGYPTRACGRCGAVGSGSFCETAGPGRGGAGTEQSGGRNLLCGDDRDEMYPVDEAAVRTVCARACVVRVHTCRGACNSAHGALCALRVCPRVGQHLACIVPA